MMKLNLYALAIFIELGRGATFPLSIVAATATIEIDTSKTIGTFSPTMHGIFFEDINDGWHAADGGLDARVDPEPFEDELR